MSMYLHTTMRIKPFRIDDFNKIFEAWKPIAEQVGWKMHLALQYYIGQAFEMIVIWEVPDANAYMTLREHVAENEEWTKWRPLLGEILVEESTKLMLKTPFSP